MKRQNEQSIGQALAYTLKKLNLQEGYLSKAALEKWMEIIDPNVYKYIDNAYVNKRILFIYLSKPELKHHLQYQNDAFVKQVNESLGVSFLKNIRFF